MKHRFTVPHPAADMPDVTDWAHSHGWRVIEQTWHNERFGYRDQPLLLSVALVPFHGMFPDHSVEVRACNGATMAPTRRVEGVGDLDATYEQTRQYVIRVRPKPVEATYMTGVSDEELQRARQAVLETALQIVDEQQPPPGRVPTVAVGGEYSPEHRYVLRAYRRAHGKPTVVGEPPNPTAAEVNQAVTWWNQRQETPDA